MQHRGLACRATILGLLITSAAAPARAQHTAALEDKLAGASGADRVERLAELTDALKNDRPAQAIAYGEEALALLGGGRSPELEVRTLNELGWAYMIAGRNAQAVASIERARTVAAERGDRKGLARALNNLGVIAQRRSDTSHAVEFFEQSLDIYRSLGDERNVSGALNNLGFVYGTQLADYEKALAYHVEALKLREAQGDKAAIALSLNNIGIVYGRLGEHRKALENFSQALEIRRALPGQQNRIAAILNNIGDEYLALGELNDALAYHEHALQIRREVGDRAGTAISLKNLGTIYTSQGRLDLATRSLSDALRTADAAQDPATTALSLVALASAHRAQGNAAQAVADARRAVEIARSLDSPEVQRRAWQELSAAEERAGNTAAALAAFKKVKELDDKIFDDEKAKRVDLLERRYQTEKREAEIARLRSREAQSQLEADRRRLQLDLVIGGALVLAIIGFGLYRRRVESARIAADLSVTDTLTGARNRRYLQQTIAADLAACDRRRRTSGGLAPDSDIVFLLIDIDTFKSVNDNFGHAAGDAVLVQIAQLLKDACRASDSVIRWGGEEFLLVHRFTDRRTGSTIAERIRAAIDRHDFVLPDGRTIRRTCSIGFASYPFSLPHPEALDWEQVVAVADHALYFSKRNGGNGWIGLAASAAATLEQVQQRTIDGLMQSIASGAIVAETSGAGVAAYLRRDSR